MRISSQLKSPAELLCKRHLNAQHAHKSSVKESGYGDDQRGSY